MKKIIFVFCLIVFAVSSKAACTIDTIYAYTFITGTSIKEYNSRFIYTHDANGNETSVITQNWDVANNTWNNTSKNLYSYDSQNQKTEDISYNWNTTANNWDGNYKNTYAYDASGNRNLEILQTGILLQLVGRIFQEIASSITPPIK
jgi:hypothetical protein